MKITKRPSALTRGSHSPFLQKSVVKTPCDSTHGPRMTHDLQLADTPSPEGYTIFHESSCSYTEIQEKWLKFYDLSYAE